MQNTAVYAPITFEEIVMVMIRAVIVQLHMSCACNCTVVRVMPEFRQTQTWFGKKMTSGIK